jgi:cytochrome b5
MFHQHPGGDDLLLEYAGRDASLAFRGTGHTEHAVQLLKTYEIGELPPHECIFRCKNGLKLSNLPD